MQQYISYQNACWHEAKILISCLVLDLVNQYGSITQSPLMRSSFLVGKTAERLSGRLCNNKVRGWLLSAIFRGRDQAYPSVSNMRSGFCACVLTSHYRILRLLFLGPKIVTISDKQVMCPTKSYSLVTLCASPFHSVMLLINYPLRQNILAELMNGVLIHAV